MRNIGKLIYLILKQTGPTGYYKGIDQLVMCVEMVLENENRMKAIQKDVYPKVARADECEPHCVERNIRKVITAMDVDELARITGTKITKKLTPKALVSILVNYIKYS